MKDKEIKKIILNRFSISLILSIVFIISILLIILGVKYNKKILVAGLLTAILLFYLLPLLWFNYAAWKFYLKVYLIIIESSNITSLEISKALNKKDKDVTKAINVLISYNLLEDYVFKDQFKVMKK